MNKLRKTSMQNLCNSITVDLPCSNGNVCVHRPGRWKRTNAVEYHKKRMKNKLKFTLRSIFRSLTNICDGAFLRK